MEDIYTIAPLKSKKFIINLEKIEEFIIFLIDN